MTVDRHRYPGVRSFLEPDSGRFFGRHHAAEELLLRVLSVRLLLQFAPSGAGKTSLLNAGLFPRLRPHGYLPVNVRLNHTQETLVQAVERSLRDAAKESALKDPAIPENPATVRELLAGAQLWSRELLLQTPVLVFDQFEEVFTLRDEAFRRQFALEIGELSRARSERADGEGAAAPDVKIIISLREEYLGALEEMTAAIPDLFRERLRLAPLTADEARDAIVEPARLDGDWVSPKFEFEDSCLNGTGGLIDFIDGVSERVHVIEPLTLQLVCQKAEAIVTARAAESVRPVLRLDDFGGAPGLESLVHNYYTSELDRLGNRTTRSRAAAMFEQGLLDPSGKRLMLEQDEIQRAYKIGKDVLDQLVDSRLLRREPRNESVFYEISHDRLTDVISQHRSVRLPKWVLPALAAAALLIVVLAGFLIRINAAKHEAERARQDTSRALNVLFGDALALRLREAGLADTLQEVLAEAPIDDASAPLVRARQLRRRGELAWERDTLASAGLNLTSALAVIDEAMRAGDRSPALIMERAQVLKDLGDVHHDKNEVTQAERRYREAATLWNEALKADGSPLRQLDAADSQASLAGVLSQVGDATGAEKGYVDAAQRALSVLKHAYDQPPDERPDTAFTLGRAMQAYSDASLSLARVWLQEDDLKSARALAAELLRMRPLSAQARIQLGTASATFGGAIIKAERWPEVRRLLDESHKQFEELTQFDRSNRRMAREMAAVQLLTAQAIGLCAAAPDCRKQLRPGELEAAENSALDSIGRFQALADKDHDSRALQDDIAWGREVQASLKRARGERDEAIALIDRSIALRGPLIVDPRDVEHRLGVAGLMRSKAEILEDAGRREEALRLLDDSLAAVRQLPPGGLSAYQLNNDLSYKADLLTKLGREDEAAQARTEAAELLKKAGDPATARTTRASTLRLEARTAHLAALKAPAGGPPADYEAIVKKYQQSLAENPLAGDTWGSLESACSAVAEHVPDAEGPAASVTKRQKETALRCALESAWMAWVLSDGSTGADSKQLKKLYEDRRELAKFLRNDTSGLKEALMLAEQGVSEAEARAELARPTPEGLSLMADAYFGLAMMREENKTDGWEEAFHVAIHYGEQSVSLEPANVEHRIWLSTVRNELAKRLDNARRDGSAAVRELAQRDCQDAVKLARTPEDRKSAQSCADKITQ